MKDKKNKHLQSSILNLESIFKVGIGYDIHPLKDGKNLILGGIKIPFHKKLSGHSDGDCLTHSIIDALLGALNKGDIGKMFGVKKPMYKNISSIFLLKKVISLLNKEEYKLNNLDVTVICEKPKLKNHTKKMQDILAKVLNVKSSRVSIKATTSKKLGVVGKGEAIASFCIVSIIKKLKIKNYGN